MGAERAQPVAESRPGQPVMLGGASAASRAALAVQAAPAGGGGEARQETAIARGVRAECLAVGRAPGEIARLIHAKCGPAFGTTLVRAHRLALGIALADVVAQVRARYVAGGRTPPRFSETLLSAYESGQKRPGPGVPALSVLRVPGGAGGPGLPGRLPVRQPAPLPGPGFSARPGRAGGPPPAAAPRPSRPGFLAGLARAARGELLPPWVPPAPGGEPPPVPARGAHPAAAAGDPLPMVIHPACVVDQVRHPAVDPEPEAPPLFLLARAARARAAGHRPAGRPRPGGRGRVTRPARPRRTTTRSGGPCCG